MTNHTEYDSVADRRHDAIRLDKLEERVAGMKESITEINSLIKDLKKSSDESDKSFVRNFHTFQLNLKDDLGEMQDALKKDIREAVDPINKDLMKYKGLIGGIILIISVLWGIIVVFKEHILKFFGFH